MTNKSGNSHVLTRSFINQNFVIDHESFIVKNLLINNSLFYKVTEKCRLHPLKKDFYLKITFLEFIHFRVNILIMIRNTYLFKIKFMKKIWNTKCWEMLSLSLNFFLISRGGLKGQRRHFFTFFLTKIFHKFVVIQKTLLQNFVKMSSLHVKGFLWYKSIH